MFEQQSTQLGDHRHDPRADNKLRTSERDDHSAHHCPARNIDRAVLNSDHRDRPLVGSGAGDDLLLG